MTQYDVIIRGAQVVSPESETVTAADIAISDGKIAAIEATIDPALGAKVVDAQGLHAFPGVVDAHQHWGIYNPLDVDAASESRASAQGGVTTALNYMRTGQYYLNRGGSYEEFFPEVLKLTEGRSHIDYAFHLAPMSSSHIGEIGSIVDSFGVTSFKIFMFYGSHGLHGKSSDQSSFLMIPEGERYDYAHFEFVMRGLEKVRREKPEIADQLSLSLHCETAEIMTAYTKLVEAGDLTGLEAYSASRPPHSEGLAITIASFLANETELTNINLLHLTSGKAFDAAMRMAKAFPNINFKREVTAAHLLTDYHTAGIGAKVNPPIRSREDVEQLWEHMLAGNIDWVVSDHACCKDEMKFGSDRDDVFLAKSGFGGAEYLLTGLITEGQKRGLSLPQVARLTSYNPAQRYGLGASKGNLKVGYDADIALVDLAKDWTVRAEDSVSAQEYSALEGFEMSAAVTDVFLRGNQILSDGAVIGDPQGHYLNRPI